MILYIKGPLWKSPYDGGYTKLSQEKPCDNLNSEPGGARFFCAHVRAQFQDGRDGVLEAAVQTLKVVR
jgi:hypothetical protein